MKTVVEHLSNLIRIPSPSSLSNRPIIDYAVDALHRAQWTTQRMVYRDAAGVEKINLLAAPPGQSVDKPEAELVFMCHTDTVPYAAGWTEAIEPFVADGLLYGCGSCDVKGFLACVLTAIAEIDSSTFMEGLRLVLTADEEVGCVGAKHLLASGLIKPERVVIGEPTSLHPARAGKGYCLAEITVFGHEAHSAHPQQGISAIYRAARLVLAIEEFGVQLVGEKNNFFNPAYTTLNIGTIQGGTAKNIIPGRCSFQLEWRPIPGEALDAVPTAVYGIADALRDTDPDFRCELKVVRQQAGFETTADSELLRSIEAMAARPAISIPFGSEAPLLATVAEEVIVFGPGDMRTAHSSRECVPVDELEEAVLCMKSLMRAPAVNR